MHAVEPRGLSGGLCLFWKEMSQVVLLKYADFFIEVVIKDEENGAKWRFFAVYASTDERVRRSQWQILHDRMAQCQEACLLMGDFNDIMDVSEKREVNSHLLNLGYVGHPFTWRNRRQEGGIMERLDRGFGNDQWVTLYPAATVHHVVVPDSDHVLLLLQTQGPGRKWRKRFIFYPRWGDLEGCRKVVEERWCRQFTGSRGLQISGKLCWQQLKATYLAPDFDRDEVLQLESSIKEAFREEETLARRRANRMVGLEDSAGRWCTDDSEFKPLILSYFQKIFTTCSPSNIEYITDCVQPRVTMQQNACLTRQISFKEIWLAVKCLNPTKSPGPDGFMGKFFQQYWDVVGEDISGMVKSFFHSGKLHRTLNHTHLVLIPKMATPRKMTQWRPIALCNLVYKIISKILTARLKVLLPEIINLNQSAFIEDRLITDNILIVHEILHLLKTEGELGRSLVFRTGLKLDMAKAYDRVEWPFVEHMMRRLGIDSVFRSWVMECVSTVTYSVIVNGEATGYILPSRGLRQGSKKSEVPCRASDFIIKEVVLHTCSSPMIRLYFAKLMNVRLARVRKQVGEILQVRNKINAKLMGWSEQYLSQAGKEVLIKAVAMAMPNYAMSCFQLPINLCKEIEREIIRYWWKGHKEHKGIHWVGWQRLSMLKEAGGMGFRDLRCFNLAMLAKIGWRIIKHPDSLLATTYRDKYFRSSNFMSASGGRGTSWGWKGILQCRKILEAGMRWRIGNGHQGLIDDQTKMWNRDLILRCFNSAEAQTILSLPLSRWGCDDRLVWHFTTHGGYSVRTNYELALTLRKSGELGGKAEGECSYGNDRKKCWKSIWRLQLDASQLIGEEFSKCWDNLLQKYEKHQNSQEILQVVVFGLWRLWKTRNSAVFEGSVMDPTTMVGCLHAQVQEYRAARMAAKPLINELPRPPDRVQQVPTAWTKPPHGWVKANCDEAWLQQTQK
ncbi:unnamed protein product [Prunus armeniaca]|uniref:Uncharacterized protein n=1 Tax=Prunus armeniaca TaxID=36596 RepID=A0A6J5WZ67_PRUAR|nr:unnamed protein product [Prunus armeniaca]